MKRMITKAWFLFCLCLLSSISVAQTYQLNSRSAIGFNVGLYAGSTSANAEYVNGYNSSASTNGFAGSMFFYHWLKEDLSLKLSIGLLTGSASVSLTANKTVQQASAVIPVLLGLNYYFTEPTESDAIRPFVGGAIGMYIGSEAKNTMISQEVSSETAAGLRAGIGCDFLIGNHFILGAEAGYNVMANFTDPIGGKNNFNGADFSLEVSYVF